MIINELLNHDNPVWVGRDTLKVALYMATLVEKNRHPIIAAFYNRLLEASKVKKVV